MIPTTKVRCLGCNNEMTMMKAMIPYIQIYQRCDAWERLDWTYPELPSSDPLTKESKYKRTTAKIELCERLFEFDENIESLIHDKIVGLYNPDTLIYYDLQKVKASGPKALFFPLESCPKRLYCVYLSGDAYNDRYNKGKDKWSKFDRECEDNLKSFWSDKRKIRPLYIHDLPDGTFSEAKFAEENNDAVPEKALTWTDTDGDTITSDTNNTCTW